MLPVCCFLLHDMHCMRVAEHLLVLQLVAAIAASIQGAICHTAGAIVCNMCLQGA